VRATADDDGAHELVPHVDDPRADRVCRQGGSGHGDVVVGRVDRPPYGVGVEGALNRVRAVGTVSRVVE